MATIVAEATLSASELDDVVAPRRGLVEERPVGGGRYLLVEGPVRDYRRTVATERRPDGRTHVSQTVEFRSSLRYFAWFFALPLRRHLGRLGRSDAMPWWAPPDRLDRRSAMVLDQTAMASFVVGFLATLLTQTATFAADEFGVGDTAQGRALAITRAAAILTLPVVALADRRGRRAVIIAMLVVGPLVAATGAFAPSMDWLAVSGLVTRAVALALGIAVAVMLAEEMPPNSRAYSVSLVSMAGALGVGAVLFALPLADLGERAWRAVYLVPLLSLPLAFDMARRLPESKRYQALHRVAPVAGHGSRLWLLAAAGFLIGMFGAPASQFQNEFLRDDLGFSAGRISLFAIATNTPGAIGVIIGGRLAERARRPVAAIGIIGGTVATAAMFASVGWTVWAWSLAGAVVGALTIPALGVYGPELFPTSLRGRANGLVTVIALVGSVIGLLAVGALSDRWDGFGPAFVLMAVGPLLAALVVLTAYPETAHRTLEELNPEDAPPPTTRDPAPNEPGPHAPGH